VGRTTVRTATGPQTLDHSYAWPQIQGKDLMSFVLVSDTYPGVPIGVTTLEGMGFTVDPKSGKLVDSELLLL
jgi:predicted aspartyl protease